MKIALPGKEEVGRWTLGMSVLLVGCAVGKSGISHHLGATAIAWLLLFSCVLLYLTARANVYALIRRRERGDIAGK